MDEASSIYKKRRYKSNHNDYQPRYRKHSKDWNWRSDSESFREETRYQARQTHQENVRHNFTESEPPSCDIQIHLIGRKTKDPMIHVCETCSLPIRSYGRMIPCKHVFCFSCAKKTDNNCPRCKESVQRIEQCPLGSVWLCSVTNACKRTYLSQRDLQAHVDHRHKTSNPTIPHPILLPHTNVVVSHPPITVPPPPPLLPHADTFLLAASTSPVMQSALPPTSVSDSTVITRPSSNLITIQIQDSGAAEQTANFPPPPPPRRPHNQPQLHVATSQPSRF